MPGLFVATLPEFVGTSPTELLGHLTTGLANEGFDTTRSTTFSWQQEITELQDACSRLVSLRSAAARWTILLEYVLPVVRKRIDCVILADDVIYIVEYKGGTSASASAALRQAQGYALSLEDFHEESRGRRIVALAVGQFKTTTYLDPRARRPGGTVGASALPLLIDQHHSDFTRGESAIDADQWNCSRYFPVPTIIEAASAIYQDHDVLDIAHSRAGTENLDRTQKAVGRYVELARASGAKLLILVTGVPGAGKTLAGLNIIQTLSSKLDLGQNQAAFLSGNGPLVAVLQTALKRDLGTRRGVARSVEARIREIHRFARDTYGDAGKRPPADRLIVFDEAQRAWTAAKNREKFSCEISEPEMILEVMARHQGWAVVVGLIGGGQEIHGGEAGLAAWGDALATHPDWQVATSPEALHGGPSVAGSRLFRAEPLPHLLMTSDPDLHLNVSRRSFESEVTAGWVNAFLDGRVDEAARLASQGLPIYVTRDLAGLREWLRSHVSDGRRAGLVASSGAARLRADGVEQPTFKFMGGIQYVEWFLQPHGDHRSSCQLEVALSEFEMQGLEVDVAGLLWGGDLLFPDGVPTARKLRGARWVKLSGTGDPHASADDSVALVKNKYRVLLTRFRKAMAVFIPRGSVEDPTRSPADFDGVHQYAIRCGLRPLPPRVR